jgi:hypothetical protein
MYVTKKSTNDGTIAIVARKATITQALYQHLKALESVDDPEEILTINPKGIIYGYGNNLRHFRRNKQCRFCLLYGFRYGVDDV